jgi:glucose dehydrogenase
MVELSGLVNNRWKFVLVGLSLILLIVILLLERAPGIVVVPVALLAGQCLAYGEVGFDIKAQLVRLGIQTGDRA